MPIDPYAALNAILRAEAARAEQSESRRRAAGAGGSGSSGGSGGSGGPGRETKPVVAVERLTPDAEPAEVVAQP
ncbi:hypothetical protein [Streptomyces sp. AK02-01A]|uniref:hypothetical protein n=1 Tax=Streptomyces sp. AK02-01A TaxID=3028648 RepID=UPI0029A8BABF|nr:hypothetical protein [Streptomyces sp. AK02-01A]MDX3854269.1 hypothetical protein [Streptomyces sp. AK02-01A]